MSDRQALEAAAAKVGGELIDMIFSKAQAENIPGHIMVVAMACTLTAVIKGGARTPEAYRRGLAMVAQWINSKIEEAQS